MDNLHCSHLLTWQTHYLDTMLMTRYQCPMSTLEHQGNAVDTCPTIRSFWAGFWGNCTRFFNALPSHISRIHPVYYSSLLLVLKCKTFLRMFLDAWKNLTFQPLLGHKPPKTTKTTTTMMMTMTAAMMMILWREWGWWGRERKWR